MKGINLEGRYVLVRAVLACGLVMGAGRAGAGSPELDGLKKGYREELFKTVLPLREGYLKALQGLESQLAAKGDYAAAGRVQQERTGMERLMGRTPAPSPIPAVIQENAGQIRLEALAENTGGVRWEGGAWVGWVDGASLRWVLPAGLPAGGYTVELAYAAGTGGSFSVGLKEDFHTLTREIKVSATPKMTSPDGVVRVGTMRVRGGAQVLELKLTGAPKVSDFRLFELRLIQEGAS